MAVSDYLARRRWNKAQKQVNDAAQVFMKHGLGYSAIDGIVGDTSSLSKTELKAINGASSTMKRNNAGYYRNAKSFTSKDAIPTTRNIPLKLANYSNVQKKNAEMYYTSSHMKAAIKFIQRTIFDTRLESSPNRRRLGLSVDEIQEWAAETEAEWRTDKYEKSWSRDKQDDYTQLSDIALLNYLSLGEFFAIRRVDRSLPSGLSIQIISPFQIGSPFFGMNSFVNYRDCSDKLVRISSRQYLSELQNGNYISNGIEYDKHDREIAIYVSPANLKDGWTRIPVTNRNGFTQVLHGFIKQQAGQKRGMPETAMAYHEFMNIKDLQKFELESAKINATIAGTVTSDSNAQPDGKTPMNDLGWEDPESNSSESASVPEYTPPSYDVRKIDNGGFIVQNFTPGYKYAPNDTKRPNVNNAVFIEKELEYIYPATTGISVTCARQRFDTAYSASKGAIDLTWKQGIEYHLKQFSSDWHRPNYNAWLTSKVATGRIVAIGYEDEYKRSAWQSSTIITPPKPSLNPLQEAKASAVKAENGFSNRDFEAQQMNGTSFEENTERLGNENEKLKDANSAFEDSEVIDA